VISAYFQGVYVTSKYGPLILNDECPWCEDGAEVSGITYISFNANHVRLVAPSDPDFLASVLWMRIAYYFGSNALKSGGFEYYFDMLNLVTDLSPKWKIPYLYGAILLPSEVGDIEGGFYLIEKGLGVFPECWQLWFFKGYYLWKYYSDRLAASDAMRRASQLEGAPTFLSHLSDTFHEAGLIKKVENLYKDQIHKTITDPKYKEFLN